MEQYHQPPCEKVLAERTNPIPPFLLSDPVYLLLPFLMKELSNCLVQVLQLRTHLVD